MDIPALNLEAEVGFKTSRSGGSGGQNVNKVSTKVELTFDIAASQALTDEQKALILEKLGPKLTKDGILRVVSQTERTQLGNRKKAFEKLYAMIAKCFEVRKKRKPSKPSKAVREKRLKEKKHTSEIKKMRRNDI